MRNRSLGAFKFVRQQPVGPYIADFLCRTQKLIIEVDGATHGNEEQTAHDARRATFLAGQGYRIIRIDNNAVFTDLGSVLDYIVLETSRLSAGTSSVTS